MARPFTWLRIQFFPDVARASATNILEGFYDVATTWCSAASWDERLWCPRFGQYSNTLCGYVPTESGISGKGNKCVTSKRGYQYQRLDGEACIFCRWQGCQDSRHSHDLRCGRNQSQDGYFKLKKPVLTSMAEVRFVCIIYRWTSVLLCCVSFISFVEPLLLCA